MEKETNNIITKNIKNYNNFSYCGYSKKEEKNITETLFQNSFMAKEEKSLGDKIVGVIRKEVFWGAIPIIFSIFYFALNIKYKISMKNKFNLPIEYFKVDLSETLYYLFFFIILPILFSYFLYYILVKELEDNIIKFIIQLIFLIIIPFYFYSIISSFSIEKLITKNFLEFFVIYTIFFICHFLSNDISTGIVFFSIDCSLLVIVYSNSRHIIFIVLSIYLIFIFIFFKYNFLLNDMFSIGILFFSIDSLLFSYIFYLNSKYMSLIFLILFFILFSVFFLKEMCEIENEFFFLLDVFIYLFYIIFYLLFTVYTSSSILTEGTEYEIFYKDRKPKVIITTYEGKYLIADCKIDYKNNKLIINTEDYDFIDINEAKKISYIDFNETPKIEIDKNKKGANK